MSNVDIEKYLSFLRTMLSLESIKRYETDTFTDNQVLLFYNNFLECMLKLPLEVTMTFFQTQLPDHVELVASPEELDNFKRFIVALKKVNETNEDTAGQLNLPETF